jgi:hypothetical protein
MKGERWTRLEAAMQPESLAEASRKYFRKLLTEARWQLPKSPPTIARSSSDAGCASWCPQRIVIEDDERRAPANFIDNPSNSGPPPQGA